MDVCGGFFVLGVFYLLVNAWRVSDMLVEILFNFVLFLWILFNEFLCFSRGFGQFVLVKVCLCM